MWIFQLRFLNGILLLLVYCIQVVAQDTINEELATTIHHHHYLHPPLEELLLLNTSDINTYLQKLDPYFQYFLADEYQIERQNIHSRVKMGLGINILEDNGQLIAVPFKKGAAYVAGFKHPQYLVKINNQQVSLKKLSALPQLVPGTIVPIEVSHRRVTKRYNVRVSAFRQPSIELIREANNDLIRFHNFRAGETSKLLRKFVHHLIGGEKKIILDLRYSPGGSLFEALDCVSAFLPPETPLIRLVDRADYQEEFTAVQGEVAQNRPIYVLVSPYTASSAEVFSLILKHYGRATIIGTGTQGKCLSQQMFDFEDGSALKLSVYEIIGPDNRSCQNVGVVPDIQIDKRYITETSFIVDNGVNVVAK
jgi:carboxyl-terminal processing protease